MDVSFTMLWVGLTITAATSNCLQVLLNIRFELYLIDKYTNLAFLASYLYVMVVAVDFLII